MLCGLVLEPGGGGGGLVHNMVSNKPLRMLLDLSTSSHGSQRPQSCKIAKICRHVDEHLVKVVQGIILLGYVAILCVLKHKS